MSLALPTYFSQGSGFMGPTSSWTGVMAVVGFVYGIVPGAVIGLLAAWLKANKAVGAIIGASVGMIILFIFIALGIDPHVDTLYFTAGALCIPSGAVAGLAVSLITGRKNLDQSKGGADST